MNSFLEPATLLKLFKMINFTKKVCFTEHLVNCSK